MAIIMLLSLGVVALALAPLSTTPLRIPDCFRATARADFAYPYPSLRVTRLVVVHADLRSGDVREDFFDVDTHSSAGDLAHFHTSIFRESSREHVAAMPRAALPDGSAVPAMCAIMPHATDFAARLRHAQLEYIGPAEVEAAVAAVDSALSADAETLLLHEYILTGLAPNVTIFAHLSQNSGAWQPMIIEDAQQRVVYTLIELQEGCDVFDESEAPPSRTSPAVPVVDSTGARTLEGAVPFRELLFNAKHSTALRCEPLG